jgi:hypothetical protein
VGLDDWKKKMNRRSAHIVSVALLLASLLPAASASADSLDGRWCTFDGRRMAINGPAVMVPGRGWTTGEYFRGALVYGVPGRQPGTRLQVSLSELDEENLEVAIDGARAEIWHRCGPPMS